MSLKAKENERKVVLNNSLVIISFKRIVFSWHATVKNDKRNQFEAESFTRYNQNSVQNF